MSLQEPVHADDVADLERAIVAAVAPAAVEEMRGWILAFDRGTVSRARSAAPLSHETGDADVVDSICEAYAAHRLPPMFRVARMPSLAAVEARLARSGLQAQQPTDVQLAQASRIARMAPHPGVRIDTKADDAWAGVFLGEGFDPVDGASRVRTLTRAPGSLFASIREEDGTVVAAGVLSLAGGWAGIHGMRTALSHRGRGLATRVLAALAQAALERGYPRIMLQVERANEAAQSVYARCGFRRAWTYAYWREVAGN
jgi:GNAT superfamily N-acetyltransferase